MAMTTEKTRSITKEARIAAPVDVVWKALTEGEELRRWFPVDARVKPGVGGAVFISWGPGMEGEAKIEVWEPNRHLREVHPSQKGVPLTLDWMLEGKGGETILRCVQSGFGFGSDWDDEFDSIELGWGLYLRNLRHYLERHRGIASCHRLFKGFPVTGAKEETWQRLVRGVEGKPGSSYSVTTATGLGMKGKIEVRLEAKALAVTLEDRNDSLARFTIAGCGGQCFLAVESYLYGVAPDVAAAWERDVTAFLEAVARP